MSEPLLCVEAPGSEVMSYAVHVGRGLLPRLGELVAAADLPAHRYVIISDADVADLYGPPALEALATAGLSAELLTFPAGEAHKSRATWIDLTDRMLASRVGRDAAIIALGGGVTGDLAGFIASTYMRGIPFVAVPTSLLAMLDSSIGGKTGVDADAVKNAVGTFHHPRLVLIDPDLLSTLPEAHLRAGLAEGVKSAAIRDGELFAWIETHAKALSDGESADLERLIAACLRIKAEVVAADPHETGLRQVLNFGHTAGHALETMAGLSLLHGEAVGAGMRIEARLGELVGATVPTTGARINAVLEACGVPDVLSPGRGSALFGTLPTAKRLLDVARADKKARSGRIRWVLLREIGEVARASDGAWSHSLDPDDLPVHLAAALRTTGNVPDFAP